MASGWHNKLSRVSRMSWEEVQTRLGQELHKRGDLLRHRLGFRSEAIRLNASATSTGNFFISSGEIRQRAELIRQHLPEQGQEIIDEADEICQHRFRLLGYENLDYGKEIDWHLDRVHGKRAPVEPWPRINFLDFAIVGDHKVTWELNRHQHLVTLAKAWRLTGDGKYVRELIGQWRHWVKANPYPLGINWGSTLEVAFRSLSWIWVDRLLADAAQQSGGPPSQEKAVAEFRADLLPALAFHGRYIERYLSTYFSPNTHLLGEAVAMFFLGTLYPQMPHASRWKADGWKIVLHEAGRQVRPDGVYFEQSLHYHVYALDFFLYARLLAAANGTSIASAFDATLQRMLSVVQALAQAGPAEGFGDDDGGRLFNPRRNRTEHVTDPLALGALAYDRNDLAAPLTEESIWLFGERAVEKLTQATPPGACTSTSFTDGGVYVLADGDPGGPDSKPCTQAMMIDAGPQGIGRCGHGHADALSIRLTVNGSRWLVDSGSGVYISDDPKERNAFRATAAHNTLAVDGVDQAIPDEPFSWTSIPTTRVENWITGKTFTYFSGSHNGYERLADPVTHSRSLLRVNGAGSGIWWVRDMALGSSEHDLVLNWHFAPELSVRETGSNEFLVSRPEAGQLTMRMILPSEAPWKTAISRGSLSPSYGRYEPAPVVQSKSRVKLPTEIATAFFMQTETSHTRKTSMIRKQDQGVHAYQLQSGDQIHEVFFASDSQNWSLGPWSSDAEVFYCRMDHEKIVQLIVIGGTTVTWQGQPLVIAGKASEFFEWRKQDGVKSGDGVMFSVSPLLNDLAGTLVEKP